MALVAAAATPEGLIVNEQLLALAALMKVR